MNKTEQYIELLNTTEKFSGTVDYSINSVSRMLKNILTVAHQMKYNNVISTVDTIINQYGKVKVGRLGEHKNIKYLVVNPPIAIREKIQNLMYQHH